MHNVSSAFSIWQSRSSNKHKIEQLKTFWAFQLCMRYEYAEFISLNEDQAFEVHCTKLSALWISLLFSLKFNIEFKTYSINTKINALNNSKIEDQ